MRSGGAIKDSARLAAAESASTLGLSRGTASTTPRGAARASRARVTHVSQRVSPASWRVHRTYPVQAPDNSSAEAQAVSVHVPSSLRVRFEIVGEIEDSPRPSYTFCTLYRLLRMLRVDSPGFARQTCSRTFFSSFFAFCLCSFPQNSALQLEAYSLVSEVRG